MEYRENSSAEIAAIESDKTPETPEMGIVLDFPKLGCSGTFDVLWEYNKGLRGKIIPIRSNPETACPYELIPEINLIEEIQLAEIRKIIASTQSETSEKKRHARRKNPESLITKPMIRVVREHAQKLEKEFKLIRVKPVEPAIETVSIKVNSESQENNDHPTCYYCNQFNRKSKFMYGTACTEHEVNEESFFAARRNRLKENPNYRDPDEEETIPMTTDTVCVQCCQANPEKYKNLLDILTEEELTANEYLSEQDINVVYRMNNENIRRCAECYKLLKPAA